MLKRLVIGLIKGLVVGGAIGAGLTYGLHWSPAAVPSGGLLGFLLAMGGAGTTGIFAGKPPWVPGAWLEALLKGGVGVGVGALLYWLGATYTGFIELPLPGVAEAGPWTSLPVVFMPAIAGIYGSLVELDNTGDDTSDGKKGGAAPRTRVAVDAHDDAAYDATEHATSTKAAKRRA